MSETEPKPSFWSTIPVVLKALGGLLIAVATLLGALTAAGFFPRNGSSPTTSPSAPTTSPSDGFQLEGEYSVEVTLTNYPGKLAQDDELWGDPDPEMGEQWPTQVWVFESDRWKVEERPQLDGERRDDGVYEDRTRAECDGYTDAPVVREFKPTSTEPADATADTFEGTLSIYWFCEATGPVDATFSVEGTSV